MENNFTILIGDRNAHICDFLRREISAAGYGVRLAGSGAEIIRQAYAKEPIDLVIIDPDLGENGTSDLMNKLLNRIPVLPVIIHSHKSEVITNLPQNENLFFVEKKANSIESIKSLLPRCLSYRRLSQTTLKPSGTPP
jgi:DNA-binding NtrC family response regulator